MRRRFISNKSESNNIIRYTSTDGNVVIPYAVNFGTSLISNTYTNKGLMTFKSDVTSIGDRAFNGCSSLTSIQIPNSVTSIGYSAFSFCDSLTSIEIPNSVTSIGEWALGYCSNLSSVYIKATTPPTLGNEVFYMNASGRKIYVPRASLDAYKTANRWKKYADAIEPYDFDGSVNEITFYIDDQNYVTPMKALPNMTWGEFVNSEYANQNSMFTNFRLFDIGSYREIKFYHEEAMCDMTLYDGLSANIVDSDIIEDGKTYQAY